MDISLSINRKYSSIKDNVLSYSNHRYYSIVCGKYVWRLLNILGYSTIYSQSYSIFLSNIDIKDILE
jgi:hypothetical protein